jgi:NADH-quinone oxidoreductase subunit D
MEFSEKNQDFPQSKDALKTEEYFINMGPQHPSTHGVLRLVLNLDGETVLDVVPHLGYIHRGIEKMCESNTWIQNVHLTDRIDYLSAMHCNWAYCLAVEKLAQIAVPSRAEYIRVLVSELNRLASHCLWFGAYGMDVGAQTAFFYGFRERELIVDLLEELCGQRLTYHYIRIGGVACDLPVGFENKVKTILPVLKKAILEYEELISKNIIFQMRTKDIGVLNSKRAVAYGCSGPVLRASGICFDLRKDETYSVFKNCVFDIPVGEKGDSWDRYQVRIEEMRQSIRILEQILEMIPEGTIAEKIPRVFKPPVGESYARLETSRGEMGVYVASDGSVKPTRVKFRTACFNNLECLPEISRGLKVADVVSILGSLDLVIPDIDR